MRKKHKKREEITSTLIKSALAFYHIKAHFLPTALPIHVDAPPSSSYVRELL